MAITRRKGNKERRTSKEGITDKKEGRGIMKEVQERKEGQEGRKGKKE